MCVATNFTGEVGEVVKLAKCRGIKNRAESL